jgi:glutamyl-tRNA synthetase
VARGLRGGPGLNAAGRFAPSPTGTLHLGNLRTALLAWLYARAQGAPFLVRIEDLDTGRVRPHFEREQLADLAAIGLDWDGEPVRQSERLDLYVDALARLEADGVLYPCWCTRAEIREASSAPHGPLPEGHYPGTCRRLTAAQRAEREAAGRPPALRVDAGAAEIAFEDRLHGAQRGVVDDFVVRRNDGAFAYNLAVVVDDGAQAIGEIVRGDDLLDSTPRQLWLADRLGLGGRGGITFTHVPLVLGPDGARLAKRHGAVTLADRLEQGETAAEVRARLAASVGLAAGAERPSPAELVARFDPAGFSPPPSGPLPGLWTG